MHKVLVTVYLQGTVLDIEEFSTVCETLLPEKLTCDESRLVTGDVDEIAYASGPRAKRVQADVRVEIKLPHLHTREIEQTIEERAIAIASELTKQFGKTFSVSISDTGLIAGFFSTEPLVRGGDGTAAAAMVADVESAFKGDTPFDASPLA